jgi:GTPase SAR1 family protein
MTDDLTDVGVSIMMIRHKVVFVGDVSVGKTSILKRIGEDVFNDSYDVKFII